MQKYRQRSRDSRWERSWLMRSGLTAGLAFAVQLPALSVWAAGVGGQESASVSWFSVVFAVILQLAAVGYFIYRSEQNQRLAPVRVRRHRR